MRVNHFKSHTIRIVICAFIFFISGFILSFQKNRLLTTHALCPHCNVIAIVIDLVRTSNLPCYGYALNTMPALCEFANQNIRFSNAHTQSTRTLTSEASVFMSLYEANHGYQNITTDQIHPSIHTLVEAYKNAGYHTVFVGSQGHINVPLHGNIAKNFDTIKTFQADNVTAEINETTKALKELEQRKESDPPIFLYIYIDFMQNYHQKDLFKINQQFLFDPSFHAPEIPKLHEFQETTLKHAINSLRYKVYSKDKTLTLHKHQQILTRLEQAQSLPEAKRIFEELSLIEQEEIYYYHVESSLDAANESHRRYVQNLYDNRLASLDISINAFLNRLKLSNILKNTIVTFFSDHGESLGDNGLFGHSKSPYEVVTHIPFIMHVPNIGSQVHTPIVQLVDIMPTLLHLTGIPVPSRIVGTDLSGLFLNQSLSYPAGTFAITEEPGGLIRSIRTNKWRLIIDMHNPNYFTEELYDVQSDPHELYNIANSHKDVVKALSEQLNNMIHKAPIYPHVKNPDNRIFSYQDNSF